MKKCPFCAEEIQSEAIKCRFCNSFLNAPPGEAAAPPAPGAAAAAAAAALRPVAGRPTEGERKVLYVGSPSWRAFFAQYFWVTVFAIVAGVAGWLIAERSAPVSDMTRFLVIVVPLAVAVIAYSVLLIYRRSMIFRITTSNIETESGLLSKKIDVLELWRCRDVRYVQSLLDRILRIAHIEITTTDVSTPQLTIVGLPASRQLFEKIRDSIEIQRQSHNVVGMVQ